MGMKKDSVSGAVTSYSRSQFSELLKSFQSEISNRKDVVIISQKNEFVKSGIENPSTTFGGLPPFSKGGFNQKPLEGSAESIVAHQKEARIKKAEKLMDEMSEDFPQLKNIYEILKKRG